MKSKKKMLLALGAMSAAAIGAGATSTFAWYNATATAGMGTHVAATSGTITAQASSANMGEFVITASVTPTAAQAIDLTDDDGNCFVYVDDVKTPATPTAQKMITYVVSVVVTYSGTEDLSASECQALWQGALSTNIVKITASTAQARFKFGSSGSDYAHAAADMVRSVTNNDAKAWVFNQTVEGKANHGTSPIEIGSFYVSVDGADGGTRDTSGPSGSITFTPSVAAS